MELVVGVLLVTAFLGLYQLLIGDVLLQLDHQHPGQEEDRSGRGPVAFCKDPYSILRENYDGVEEVEPCPDITPYCDPESLICKPEYFSCSQRNGLYPDPRNPAALFLCMDGAAIPFTCDSKHTYVPELKSCSPVEYRNPCEGKRNSKVALSAERGTTFYYCGDSNPVALGECQAGYYLDEELQDCLPDCAGIGHIPDMEDSRRFTACVSTFDGGLEGKQTSCATGHYDILQGECSVLSPEVLEYRLRSFLRAD